VAHWKNLRVVKLPVHWARAGEWKGRDAIAVANGVGYERAELAVQAARTLAGSFSAMVSIGTAGALDPSLSIADVVVATGVTDGKSTWPALSIPDVSPPGRAARSGLVQSSAHIARTAEEKRKLRQSGAIIVEMESAGVARSALELAVPFHCVRAVSDLADETFFTDFESFLMPDGRFSVPSLALFALAHPVKGLGEFMRLQRRTAEAARRLGDYLSCCNF
jgi:nucleoside phosphorylase